ncbi:MULTISPECIES: hypothetical protein [unclassified Duganella]|uniref:hypothetical protein n=1 Tax=unclassified Duganella TaxID=2636909 RepID=UPI0006F96000|nr:MULTISPECIES: hypothetical protein [unclassified Duganella]KQV54213.1 hypothetical protein ASD07_06665 [Duganella sp. Root336D2]KRC03341.1 hypothetical protein ASE26_00390 [Duganella sp. Root198D2]
MKLYINRRSLAQAHAASLETKLAVARWSGQAGVMPQALWRRQQETELLEWLVQGGFSTEDLDAETKTAARGRRSLASQRDSDEECEFTQVRIRNAAA